MKVKKAVSGGGPAETREGRVVSKGWTRRRRGGSGWITTVVHTY